MASYPTTKRAKNPDTPAATSKYYLTNATLLPEVISAKEQGIVTNKLATMLMMLTRKYAGRPCFSGYTYKEDMIAEALANLCQNALKFNPEKSSNPFSFYTTCINHSFLQFLGTEKKQRRIRDQLLVDLGENPSFNFQDEYRQQTEGNGGEFKSELTELKSQIEEARERQIVEAAQAVEAALQKEAEARELAKAEELASNPLFGFDEEVKVEAIADEVRVEAVEE